jgi:hypothetical protein
MKQSATPPKGQLNLSLLDTQVTTVASSDEQKELTIALVELLIHAAHRELKIQADGGDNESSEAHA